jgi:HEAT repeat protein
MSSFGVRTFARVLFLICVCMAFARPLRAQMPGMPLPGPQMQQPQMTTPGVSPNASMPGAMGAMSALPSNGSFGKDVADKDSKIADAQTSQKSDDPVVRIEGLNEIAGIADPQVDDLLLKAMTDSDIRVQVKATDIMAERRMTAAVPLMTQYLFLRTTPQAERLHLVSALGQMGDPRGTIPVMHFLEKAPDEDARGLAAFALGELGDPRARELLLKVASEDSSAKVRRLAQEALAKIDGELPRVNAQAAQVPRVLETTDQRLNKFRELEAKMAKEHQQEP